MRARAVGFAFEERRATAGTSALDCCPGCFGYCLNVVTIHFNARDAVGRAATAHTRFPGGVGKGNSVRNLFVHKKKHARRPPASRYVESFGKAPIISPTADEKTHANTILFENLKTKSKNTSDPQ